MRRARPLAGLALVIALVLVVAVAVGLFRGSFTTSAAVIVLSPRAGLVMNPDAKVTMQGVTVGKVASIETLANGQAAIHLAMDPSTLQFIPSNVGADITSSTVFGAKFVELIPPAQPAPTTLAAGQVLQGEHVTVEINTVFQQLTDILDAIEPAKLNATLAELSKALDGRGERIGEMLSDLDAFLARLAPTLPNLRRDLQTLPSVTAAYADAAPDLVHTLESSTRISQTVVERQSDLDAILTSAIGLADIGTDVLGSNRQSLTDLLRILVPTTDLLYEYRQSVDCTLQGILPFTQGQPLPEPGLMVSIGFGWGIERYRYPSDLPKVAATGGSNCDVVGLPALQPQEYAPFVVTDIGGNRWKYGNRGLVLNSDGLKQLLFGPIDGPPRNSAQIGMPG